MQPLMVDQDLHEFACDGCDALTSGPPIVYVIAGNLRRFCADCANEVEAAHEERILIIEMEDELRRTCLPG